MPYADHRNERVNMRKRCTQNSMLSRSKKSLQQNCFFLFWRLPSCLMLAAGNFEKNHLDRALKNILFQNYKCLGWRKAWKSHSYMPRRTIISLGDFVHSNKPCRMHLGIRERGVGEIYDVSRRSGE